MYFSHVQHSVCPGFLAACRKYGYPDSVCKSYIAVDRSAQTINIAKTVHRRHTKPNYDKLQYCINYYYRNVACVYLCECM